MPNLAGCTRDVSDFRDANPNWRLWGGRRAAVARIVAFAAVVSIATISAFAFLGDSLPVVAESACSADVSSPRVPGTPRNVSAKFVNGKFKLSWDAPADLGNPSLSGYRVHWDPAESPLDELPTTISRNVPQWKGIGSIHTLKVAAVNCAGSSPLATVDALAAELPSAPRTFAVEIASTFAIISWKSPASTGSARTITGYALTYQTGSTTRTVQLANNVFEHILSGLMPGASYTFRLTAKSTYGTGVAASATATVPLPNDAPRDFRANYSGGQVVLTWRAPAAASSNPVSGYKLTQTVGSMTASSTLSDATVRHTVSSPTAGATYSFRLAAVTNGSEGTSVTTAVTIPSAPGAPTRARAAMSGSDVQITWSAPADSGRLAVTGYKIAWSSAQSSGSGTTAASVLRYTIRSPTRGATLSITVTASSALGNGGSAIISFTVPSPPSAPRNLSLTMNGGNLVVSWDAPSQSGTASISGYALEWQSDSVSNTASVAGPARSYTISSPVAGKSYTVTVAAVSSAGKGPSATGTFTIPSAPGVPRNLTARMSGSDLIVGWNAPSYGGTSALTGYRLSWKFGSPSQTGSATLGASTTSHTIATVTAGATYQLALRATNAVGSSAAATLSFIVPSPPGAPRDLDAELQSDGKFRVSWKAPTYAGTSTITKYTLSWTVSGSAAASSVDVTGLQHDIDSPELGKTYAFSLVAVNGVGAGPSATLNAVAPSPPGKVRNLTAQMSGNNLAVSWDAPTYAGTTSLSGYRVAWVVDGSTSSKALGATVTSHEIEEVLPGKAYTVSVNARNSVGPGPGSSVLFTVPQPPGTPRDFTAKMSAGKLVLAWKVPTVTGTSAITGYALTWTVSGVSSQHNLGATVRGYTIASPAAGKTYAFSLRAVNAAGTGHNADLSFAVPSPPGAPSNLAVSVNSDGDLVVAWDAPSVSSGPEIKHYALTWTATGDGEGGNAQVGANDRSHEVASPAKGATYTFTVASVSEAGTGPSSSTSFTVPKPPGAPTNLTAGVDANGDLAIAWSPPQYLGVPSLNGYRVAWSVGEDTGSASTTQRSHKIRSPTAGATYAISITATNSAGNSSAVTLSYTVPAVPGTPRDFAASYSNGTINLTWRKPSYVGVPTLSGYLITWSVRHPRTGNLTNQLASLASAKVAHSIADAVAGGLYNFNIVAQNATGNGSGATATLTVPSKPDAPRNLDAEIDANGNLKVSWAAPTYTGTSAITGYRLTWTVDGSATTANVGAATTTYSISSPQRGKRYDLSVTATNSVGTSEATTNYLVVPSLPGSPRNLNWELTTEDGEQVLKVSWDAPANSGTSPVAGFEISYKIGQTTTTESLAKTARSYSIADPQLGATYAVTLKVRTSVGTASANLTLTVPKPPGAPGGFAAQLSSDGVIALSWSAPDVTGTSPIAGYELAVETQAGVGGQSSTNSMQLPATARKYDIANPVAGRTYGFTLAARNSAGTGEAVTSSVNVPQVPGKPGGLTAALNTDEDLVLTWSAPTNSAAAAVTGYEVSWRFGSNAQTATAGHGESPSYTLADPVAGGRYQFTVKAVGPTGKSAAALLTFTVPAPPGTPTSFAATVTSGEVKLTWDAPANTGNASLTGYELSWEIVGVVTAPESASVELTASATSYTLGSPSFGKVYDFGLHAVTSDGDGPTATFRYRVPTVPKAPTGLTARYSDGTSVISWEPPVSDGGSEVTQYVLSWDPITGTGRATIDGARTTHSITSLRAGIVYRFALVARNAVGQGSIATLDFEVSADGPTGKIFDDNPRQLPLGFDAQHEGGATRFTWRTPAAKADDPVTGFVLSWSATTLDHFDTVTLAANAVGYDVPALLTDVEYAVSLVVVRQSRLESPIARWLTIRSQLQVGTPEAVLAEQPAPVSPINRVTRRIPVPDVPTESKWAGPIELEAYQMGDSMQLFWDEPENREVLGWQVDWTPGGPSYPALLPGDARGFAFVGTVPTDSCVVKVRAIYSDGLSDRNRVEVVLAKDDPAAFTPRTALVNMTHHFGARVAVENDGLVASLFAPPGATVLGESLKVGMSVALMPRVWLEDFAIHHDERSLKLEVEDTSTRKRADVDAPIYRLLEPMDVCLSNPDVAEEDVESINSVIVAMIGENSDVLDSSESGDADARETCAKVHELALDEPMYFGLVSRELTDTDGLPGEVQQASMPFLLLISFAAVWWMIRRR